MTSNKSLGDLKTLTDTIFNDIENIDYSNSTSKGTVTTTTMFIPFGLFILLITLFGLIGNILSVLILTRTALKSSYIVLILGLTFCDSIYLFTKLLRYGFESFFTYFDIAQGYTQVFLIIVGPYLRAITFIAHTGSTYFTLALAVDRYIAICYPAQARSFCTRKNARISSIIVFIFSILYNCTRWFEFYSKKIDQNHYQMIISPLRQDPNYKLFYIFWAYLIVMFIIPFVSLIFLNFFVWIGIRKVKYSFQTEVQKRDTSFALILIGIVVLFLACNLDYLILDIMDYFGREYSNFWSHLGNCLLTINSAINFLIYCTLSSKFRQEFCAMFQELISKTKGQDLKSTSQNHTVEAEIVEEFETRV